MQGRRKSQEDSHLIEMNVDCTDEGPYDHHFMMVCDGHGGDLAAKKVKEMLLPHMLETKKIDIHGTHKERYKSYSNVLFKSVIEVDSKLLDLDPIKSAEDKSGTTVNCAFVAENEIIVANCGDTRCVVSRNAVATDLSQDHKPNRLDEIERIKAAGGFVAHGRVNGLHGVARSLGDFGYKNWGKSPLEKQVVTCKPDVLVYPSEFGEDEFVLICCDGVWDVMSSQDAVTFIHEDLKSDNASCLEDALEHLLDKCLELGSLDNMTAAIIAMPVFCRNHDYFRKSKRGKETSGSGSCCIS